MDSMKLFGYIQEESENVKILYQLKRHVNEGKKLEWFQAVIPGLIPGVDDSQPWLGQARELLWGPTQHSEHERKTDRMKRLLQASPKPLAGDRYHLRRQWPVYVEALRPMTKRMLAAVNEVYHVVAGQNCLREDRNVVRVTEETDDKHHAFVTIGIALQDKVVNPVISDIERYKSRLSKDLEQAEEQLHDLLERLGHIDLDDDQRAANKVECQAAKQRLDYITEEQQESKALLDALVRFRDILVTEKDDWDRRKSVRRDRDLEEPDSDEAGGRKRAKGAAPLG